MSSVPRRPGWAVIDIGSNSVRLVMYEGPGRSPLPILNEKVLCGLGDRDRETGALKPGPMSDALDVLRRFARLIEAYQPATVIACATAAVRDAPNGDEFLAKAADLGLSVQILSGEEEAELAALGILSGMPPPMSGEKSAHTLCGDIGGGSLELVGLGSRGAKPLQSLTSLPLGGLVLSTQFADDLDAAKAYIRAVLSDVAWLTTGTFENFAVVGGAWRALGRLSLYQSDYPLNMLDQYELQADRMADLCAYVIDQPLETFESVAVIQRRRVPTLPFAALVMQAILKKTKVSSVTVSSHGVREGLIYSTLNEEDRAKDPLRELSQFIAGRRSNALQPDTDAISAFLAPILEGAPANGPRILTSAIDLMHSGLTYHPDFRSEQAARGTLSIPFKGLTHGERIVLSGLLYVRHGGATDKIGHVLPISLLGGEELDFIKRAGLALRFVADFDPSGRAFLPFAALSVDETILQLTLHADGQGAWGRSAEKRFQRLASALGRTPIVDRLPAWL